MYKCERREPCGDVRRTAERPTDRHGRVSARTGKLVPHTGGPVPQARHGHHPPALQGTGRHRVHGAGGAVLQPGVPLHCPERHRPGPDLLRHPSEHPSRRAVHLSPEPGRFCHVPAGEPSDGSGHPGGGPPLRARQPHGSLQPDRSLSGTVRAHPARPEDRHPAVHHPVRSR